MLDSKDTAVNLVIVSNSRGVDAERVIGVVRKWNNHRQQTLPEVFKSSFRMGIYYWCAVYFDLSVNSAVKNGLQRRLREFTNNPYVFKRLNDKQWLVHCPEMLETVGSINGGLERHEIVAGAVDWSQVVKFAEKWRKPGAKVEAEILNQSLAATMDDAESKPKAGFYVIEGMWCTYDSDKMNDISVSYNLPVVNIPSDIAKEFDLEV